MPACHADCATCIGPTSNDCLTCSNADHATKGGAPCSACHSDCAVGKCYVGNDATVCTACTSGKFPDAEAARFGCTCENQFNMQLSILLLSV